MAKESAEARAAREAQEQAEAQQALMDQALSETINDEQAIIAPRDMATGMPDMEQFIRQAQEAAQEAPSYVVNGIMVNPNGEPV